MNRKYIILLAAVLLSASAYKVSAQSRALPILEVSPDARNAAMGGNQYGNSESLLTYSNPTAILYNEEKWNYSTAFHFYPKDDEVGRLKYIGASLSSRFGIHGLNIGYRSLGGYKIPIDDDKTVKPVDYTIDLAYSIRLFDHFSASVGASFISSKVFKTANTVAFNASAYYRNNVNLLAGADYVVGVNVANLGPNLKYGHGYKATQLPAMFGGGGEFGVNVNESNRVSMSLAAQYYCYPEDSKLFTGNVGAEYAFKQTVFLRAGYNYAEHDYSRATFGIGGKYRGARIDLAYLKGLGGNDVNVLATTISVALWKK